MQRLVFLFLAPPNSLYLLIFKSKKLILNGVGDCKSQKILYLLKGTSALFINLNPISIKKEIMNCFRKISEEGNK